MLEKNPFHLKTHFESSQQTDVWSTCIGYIVSSQPVHFLIVRGLVNSTCMYVKQRVCCLLFIQPGLIFIPPTLQPPPRLIFSMAINVDPNYQNQALDFSIKFFRYRSSLNSQPAQEGRAGWLLSNI